MHLFKKYNREKHSKKFLVYTVYEQGTLLYIGSTKNSVERFRQHKRYKNLVFVLECESELSMRFMEAILIDKLNPRGNKQKPNLYWYAN